LIFTAYWLGAYLRWGALAGWALLPPLDLQLSGGPWGHRYDIALLLALVYPAWWLERPSRFRVAAAVVIGLVGLALVLITGSRTVWLALAAATAVIAIPRAVGLWRRHPSARLPAIVAVAVIGIAVAATGVGAAFMSRALSLESLDWRFAMWGPLLELWWSNPIAGAGPGSFPWALQLTPYFETRTWAPRHPDSALMQVLPEAGLLGAAAMLLVGAALLVAVIRSRSTAALWVAAVFLVACIGANPTDFTFLVAVALGWVAYACPVTIEAPASSSRAVRRVGLVLTAVVFLAYGATLVGGFAYESARAAIGRQDLQAAIDALGVAMATDPGMALYARQRGVSRLESGDVAGAIGDLERATGLNPSDDVAWRSLAVAHLADGRLEQARSASERALEVQRSDPTNLLLAAALATEDDRAADAQAGLAEVAQSWPAVVGATGWVDGLVPGPTAAGIVDEAVHREASGVPMLELPLDQDVWLAELGDRPALVETVVAEGRMSAALAELEGASLACAPGTADLLGEIPVETLRSPIYWQVRIRQSSLEGELDEDAVRALEIMTGGAYRPEGASSTWTALNENFGHSVDIWGYRRYPVQWPGGGPVLPSTSAGAERWLFEPRVAAVESGLGERLGCWPGRGP
jgi:tetratricopeptide (TPR) repeat protein